MKLVFLFIFIFPSLAFANRGKDKNIVMFGVGIAGYDFHVDSKEGKREASMSNKSQAIPYLGYSRKPRPFWGSIPWLRGSLEFSIAPVSADMQNTSRLKDDNGKRTSDGVDLGTEMKGYMGYIDPSLLLFYEVTDTIYFYGGIGLGVGFASMKGDYYQVEGPGITASCSSSFRASDVIANCDKKKANFSGIELSANTILVASLGWFGMRFEMGGPTISSNNKEYSNYNSMFSFFGQYRF